MNEDRDPNANSANSTGRDEDLQLVNRVLAGEKQAFEELVRRHERRVYRVTLAITGSPEDAEEATQETFIRVYRHLAQFRRESRFTTWLTRVAVNEALQVRRARKPTVSLDDPEIPVEEDMMPRRVENWYADPEKRYAREELRRIVEAAIQSLPTIYREAYVLRDVEGLSTEEAAEALGQSVTAMKSRLLRARLMMRKALAARFEQPPSLKSRIRRAHSMLRMALAMHKERSETPGKEI
jgi:RNA polymerase sigma-70 factor, ECF subfamily